MTYSSLWYLNNNIEIRGELAEPIVKISNIDKHLYLLTKNNHLYHGTVFYIGNASNTQYIELTRHDENLKIVDIDSFKDQIFVVDLEGNTFKCNENLEVISQVILNEDHSCSKGHTGNKLNIKVKKVAVSEYGQLFITEHGHLWASGLMPQIGINTDQPKRVNFFLGRQIYNVKIGHDFAIAIVGKQNTDGDDEDETFFMNCSQCLTSPASNFSLSELTPTTNNSKVPNGSYDIETTSTSSSNKNDTSSSYSSEKNDSTTEKNIIFRNTEAAKDFLTKQLSRMSSAGEEYLVECTEKPTRIIKENVTNMASLVYEGVKTVGDKVVTLSRHMSGSSDCNSILDNNNASLVRITSKDECLWSVSQGTSEKDISEQDFKDNVASLLEKGANLINCEVWTWGNIIHGQLGVGDNIKRERPMIITKLSNIGVQKVSVQSYHASVITLDGRVYIWGKNEFNQVTTENNFDQSSPKLYSMLKNERLKDVTCGKHFTILLNNEETYVYYGKNAMKHSEIRKGNEECSPCTVPLYTNLLSSGHYSFMNLTRGKRNEFLVEIQKLLEEMLVVHMCLIKGLQKKTASTQYSNLFENLSKTYVNFMYLTAIDVNSLLEFENNMISFCDITVLKQLDEHLFIYKEYIDNLYSVISIDGFTNISKLVEIPPSLYKLKDFKTVKNNEELIISMLLTSPVELSRKLVDFLSTQQLDNESSNKLSEFVGENRAKLEIAEKTREFWRNYGKNLEFLKKPERRMICHSSTHPVNLMNSSRFSSHSFVLFNDVFVHLNGSTPHVHNLSTTWVQPQHDETSQSQYQIVLKMPEETLVLCTSEPEHKIEWFHTLQTAIKTALNKPNAPQPPNVRNCTFKFTKSGFLKDATYTGRWLNAKMQGNGKLEWTDGKNYTGQFSNNQLNGYGTMFTPNEGTYEGEWKDNQQNGCGTLTYINTDVYKGHFKDGQPYGHGFLKKGNFMANSASFYIGDWVSGMKNGYGVLDDIVIGEKYMGNWVDNKKQGNGLIVTSDGVYYEGNFNQDVFMGHGIMVLEDGTHYEGEFKGNATLCGKGTLTMACGDYIEGVLNGNINEGIKISNGTFVKSSCQNQNSLPKSFDQLCAPVEAKWRALFKYYHQVLGLPETPTKNGLKLETQRVWQNVAVVLSNATSFSRKKGGKEKLLANSLRNLDIIPPFGRESMDYKTYTEIQEYLINAFESSFHPLGALLNNLSEAYATTYGGRAHALLLKHATVELHYITKKLYDIIRHLFPALPGYNNDIIIENDNEDIVISYHSLLYPIILPKFHHPLFTLFTLKNEQQEKQYKKTLMELNKQIDVTLMAFLSVDPKFYKPDILPPKENMFLDAIEHLQQLKSTFSPIEKLLVIRETVEKLTPVVQELLGENYVWNMDDLFPIFLFVVVRSRIPDLGSELDFVDSFMDPNSESGQLGIMFTTLKACYQHILQEK